MGAGKSYTMRNLVENNRFPLIAFITVDPDQIRQKLPEFHLYVDSDPENAGTLTHSKWHVLSIEHVLSVFLMCIACRGGRVHCRDPDACWIAVWQERHG